MALDYADVDPAIEAEMRSIAESLPEVTEQRAHAGVRWQVRRRTFVHLLAVDRETGPITVMTFRSAPPELDVLFQTGHPFFRPGWGTNVVGMVITDDVDWDEVRELVTDSYCVLAPKRLAALVERPGEE